MIMTVLARRARDCRMEVLRIFDAANSSHTYPMCCDARAGSANVTLIARHRVRMAPALLTSAILYSGPARGSID